LPLLRRAWKRRRRREKEEEEEQEAYSKLTQ